ncbi:MAG TPA: peptidase S10 [Rudaea sp.]|jgi:carboxypeptidase C (cathepsin A)|nr:peptidase S10 [Rudaea sp.]
MRMFARSFIVAVVCTLAAPAWSADAKDQDKDKEKDKQTFDDVNLKPQTVTTDNGVTVGGQKIDYKAIAGTIILTGKDENKEDPTASMFYAAYFKHTENGAKRPITFFYNGGPGSSTVWLHMGAFGPKRVITADDQHTPAAPYNLANNNYSLLDATDLVFIDAPGTGFSRLLSAEKDKDKRDKQMKERKKEFYGVDQDGQAFAQFIVKFLTQYQRWNSPKYLFGESYGTTRSAVLANILETQESVDLNGVILLSQILSFSNDIDAPQFNPGVDQAYALALPTYAATAWYHHRVPNQPKELKPFLAEVEQFATTDYLVALAAGSTLDETRRRAIAQKLHDYTGLPVDYIEKANLRVYGGEFEKTLQDETGMTTGRLDTRFSGPSPDPLDKDAQYDPQSAAISSAYVSAYNDYARRELKFGDGMKFHVFGDVNPWNWDHKEPNGQSGFPISTNVMPDLANAMIYNPQLHVMLTGGYYDLATPFFAAVFEMRHLPIPAKLQSNIEYSFYESGHMVYAHDESLKKVHDDVAAFIGRTNNLH